MWTRNEIPRMDFLCSDLKKKEGIVLIHGGGFIAGTSHSMHSIGEHLNVATGLPVCSVDYKLTRFPDMIRILPLLPTLYIFIRLWTCHRVAFHAATSITAVLAVLALMWCNPVDAHPSHVEDVATCIRYIWDQHGWRHIHLVGHSAGGHLAALVSTNHRFLAAVGLAPSIVRSTTCLSGAYSTHLASGSVAVNAAKKILGFRLTEDVVENCDVDDVQCWQHRASRFKVEDAWPAHHTDSENVPAMFITTSALDFALKDDAEFFAERLVYHGHRVQRGHYPHTTHASVRRYWATKNKQLAVDVAEFIKTHSTRTLL